MTGHEELMSDNVGDTWRVVRYMTGHEELMSNSVAPVYLTYNYVLLLQWQKAHRQVLQVDNICRVLLHVISYSWTRAPKVVASRVGSVEYKLCRLRPIIKPGGENQVCAS